MQKNGKMIIGYVSYRPNRPNRPKSSYHSKIAAFSDSNNQEFPSEDMNLLSDVGRHRTASDGSYRPMKSLSMSRHRGFSPHRTVRTANILPFLI